MILKKHYLEKLTVIFAIKEDYDHREVYYYENRRFEGELHMYYDDKKQQLESIERFKNGKKEKHEFFLGRNLITTRILSIL